MWELGTPQKIQTMVVLFPGSRTTLTLVSCRFMESSILTSIFMPALQSYEPHVVLT